MLAWEIFGDDLLWIEVYTGAGFLIAVAAWVFIARIPISLLALVLTLGLVVLGAFRPIGYNSDTENYYSYVYFLRFVGSSDIFFLTKLEPLHSLLILVLQDFRLWLMAEVALMALGLVLSYRQSRSPLGFIVLCAFVLTLSTSSMRYCLALIFFFYLISRMQDDIVKAARTTVILACLHVSMLLSGAFAIQRKLAPIGIIAVCLAIFLQSSLLLGSRLEIGFEEASSGLKSLGAALVPLLYLGMRQRLEKSAYLGLSILAVLAIFVVTSTVLFTFNRFLIMSAVSTMALQWTRVREGECDIFDRGVVALMCAGIVAPYIVGLPELYFTGTW